jgi:hypothetical protein
VVSEAHVMLHDSPQLPRHALSFPQFSEQLSGPQVPGSKSHVAPAGHEHDVPLHVGACADEHPTATTAEATRTSTVNRIIVSCSW